MTSGEARVLQGFEPVKLFCPLHGRLSSFDVIFDALLMEVAGTGKWERVKPNEGAMWLYCKECWDVQFEEKLGSRGEKL